MAALLMAAKTWRVDAVEGCAAGLDVLRSKVKLWLYLVHRPDRALRERHGCKDTTSGACRSPCRCRCNPLAVPPWAGHPWIGAAMHTTPGRSRYHRC